MNARNLTDTEADNETETGTDRPTNTHWKSMGKQILTLTLKLHRDKKKPTEMDPLTTTDRHTVKRATLTIDTGS